MKHRYVVVLEVDSDYDDPDAFKRELQTAATEDEGIHVRTAGDQFEAAVVDIEEVEG